MADDAYYITAHEAALAVVATAMKKSRLPFHLLCLNAIIGAFLFSGGGMLYVMVEAGSKELTDGAYMFASIAQGTVYAIGLFYVIVCGMELFNANILFFSVSVMRGAVTIMDLVISWFGCFWINLAATIFVVYVFCFCSNVFRQENYAEALVKIGHAKNSYSFIETLLKGIVGNFFIGLAVYLQIIVKPLHVKFIMILLPVFTFVSVGFTDVISDMFLVSAAIFSHCGYGFGHFFWKIMLPGAIGNMIGGSFFGIVIPWYLHLHIIETDMKRLSLPIYEERDEQPMLNMDSRVVRVPTPVSMSSAISSIQEFKPNPENNLSRVGTLTSITSTPYGPDISRTSTSASIYNRIPKQIRSPKGVFPVAGMGEPLQKERTIASTYEPLETEDFKNNIDDLAVENKDNNFDRRNRSLGSGNEDSDARDNVLVSANSQHPTCIPNGNEPDNVDIYSDNLYDVSQQKLSSKLARAVSRILKKQPVTDLEQGKMHGDISNNSGANDDNPMSEKLAKTTTHDVGQIEKDLGPGKAAQKPPKIKISADQERHSDPLEQDKKQGDKIFRQFSFGGGGNDTGEIQRRLSHAKITRKAAGMSNEIAGIHVGSIDTKLHFKSKHKAEMEKSNLVPNSPFPTGLKNSSNLDVLSIGDRVKYPCCSYGCDKEGPVISQNEQ